MDPNANLQEQERILLFRDEGWIQTVELRRHRRERLHELRIALHEWLDNGGFQPDWSQAPRARKHFRK